MKYGLDAYYPKFEENSYTEPRDLADIKAMSVEEIMNLFEITKKAHLKKLMAAIQKLQYPSKGNFKPIETLPEKILNVTLRCWSWC